MKPLNRQSLIHAVRIAAKLADKDSERNPAYVEAMDLMATALEQATVSSRSDGDYWLVKIPKLNGKTKEKQ